LPRIARAHPKAPATGPLHPPAVEPARDVTGSRIPVRANTTDATFDAGTVEEGLGKAFEFAVEATAVGWTRGMRAQRASRGGFGLAAPGGTEPWTGKVDLLSRASRGGGRSASGIAQPASIRPPMA
jgi:hypothetical protein